MATATCVMPDSKMAVLNRVRRSSCKPTEVMNDLVDQFSYREIQDAVVGMLDSGELILTPNRYLEMGPSEDC